VEAPEILLNALTLTKLQRDIRKFTAQMGVSENSNEYSELYVRMIVDGQPKPWPTLTDNVAVIIDKEVQFEVPLPADVKQMMRHFLPLMAKQLRSENPFGVDDEFVHRYGDVVDPLETEWYPDGSGVKGIMLKAQCLTSRDRTPFGVFVLLQVSDQGVNFRIYVVSPSPNFQSTQLEDYFRSYLVEGTWHWEYKAHVLRTGRCPEGGVLSTPSQERSQSTGSTGPRTCPPLVECTGNGPATREIRNVAVRCGSASLKQYEFGPAST
jgi:hypothetical protein